MEIKKILIVDDDEITLRLLEQHLVSAGYPVIKATEGGQAVALAREKKPALILLDILMPKIDGAHASQMLKDDPATRDIPIIFLTGMLKKEEEKTMGGFIGGNMFIAKPYNRVELLKTVEKFL